MFGVTQKNEKSVTTSQAVFGFRRESGEQAEKD
jgi:hypothetical protein